VVVKHKWHYSSAVTRRSSRTFKSILLCWCAIEKIQINLKNKYYSYFLYRRKLTHHLTFILVPHFSSCLCAHRRWNYSSAVTAFSRRSARRSSLRFLFNSALSRRESSISSTFRLWLSCCAFGGTGVLRTVDGVKWRAVF
jgi:hypothetical protein